MFTLIFVAVLLAIQLFRMALAEIPPQAMPMLQLILQAAPAVLAIVGVTGGLKGLFDRVDALPGLHGIGAIVTTFIMGGIVLSIWIALGWWTFPTDGPAWNETWILLTLIAMFFRNNAGVANVWSHKPA